MNTIAAIELFLLQSSKREQVDTGDAVELLGKAHDALRDMSAALRDTLETFRTCIGNAAFADFEASNPAIIRARALLAKLEGRS